MATIRNVQSAVMHARERAAELRRNFNMEFYRPETEAYAAAVMRNLPPEILEQVRARVPDAVMKLEERWRHGS